MWLDEVIFTQSNLASTALYVIREEAEKAVVIR